jgi:uncharacterized membrane protein
VKITASPFRIPLIILFSLLLSLYLFGANFDAALGEIDDHEIVNFLGPDDHISITEFPELLLDTEVGQAGVFPRYRPSYYFLRITEAALWGSNPQIWYAARIIMAATLMAILWYLLDLALGFLPAGLLVFYIFTFITWADIFARLGPAEAYIALGLALFGLGMYILWSKKFTNANNWRNFGGWLLVTIGAIIAIGSKESLVTLVLPTLILLFLALRRRQGVSIALTSTLIIVLYAAFVAVAVWVAVSKRGYTIRAESVALTDRFQVTVDGILSLPALIMLAGSFILFLAWLIGRRTGRQEISRLAIKAFFMVAACYLVYLSQYIFYNGTWPVGNRYDFPGIFAFKPFFFVAAAWFTVMALRSTRVNRSIPNGFRGGLIAGLVLVIYISGYSYIRNASLNNVANTQGFDAKLNQVVAVIKEHPDAAVVIESHFALDYEAAVQSWPRQLRAKNIQNPIFLRLQGYSSDTVETDRLIVLTGNLERISRDGLREISPISELEQFEGNCISLQLSGYTPGECIAME